MRWRNAIAPLMRWRKLLQSCISKRIRFEQLYKEENPTRKRSQLKWAVIGAALAALLMFGMEMTSGGINQVYGPLESSQPAEVGRFAEASKAKEQLQAAQRYEADLLKLQKKYGIQPAAASGVSEDSFAGDQESAYTSGAGGTPAYGADTNTDGSYAVRSTWHRSSRERYWRQSAGGRDSGDAANRIQLGSSLHCDAVRLDDPLERRSLLLIAPPCPKRYNEKNGLVN